VQQLQKYGNKDRPDSHMDRSDVMQFKSSSTKTRVPRSQPVRTPSNAPHQKTGVSDVALGPSGRPIIPSGRPVLNLIFRVYFK
jgi:hypothetical protein